MAIKLTDHQRQQKRVEFFSAAQRQLMATDEYAGDWYGARDVANRIADSQMAQLEQAGAALPPADATKTGRINADEAARNAALVKSLGITYGTQPAPPPAAPPAPDNAPPAFGWDTIVAEVNSRIR